MKYGFLLIWFLSYNFISAQSNSRCVLDVASKAAYNLELERSDSLLMKLVSENSVKTEAFVFIARNHLWKYLGSKDPGEVGIFWRYSDLAINAGKSEKILQDKTAQFTYGWNYFLRSIAYSSQDKMYDAFLSAKRAYGIFDDIIESDSGFYDAYLGRGLIKYSLGYIPGIFRWLLPIVGLKADLHSGFEDVKTAFLKGEMMRPEAGFHYARLLDEYFADYSRADSLLGELSKEFPDNILFSYQRAVSLLNMDDFNKAEEILIEIINSDNSAFSQTIALSYFLIGEAEYFKMNFSDAAKYYEEFIGITRSIDYTGIAHLRLAVCYKILNDDELSRKHLFLSGNGNLDLDEDIYAEKLGNYFIRNGFNRERLGIIKLEILCRSKSVNDNSGYFKDLIFDKLNADWQARGLLAKARVNFRKGNYSEAAEILSSIDPDNFELESFHATEYFLLYSQSCLVLNDTSKAILYLNKAEDENTGLFAGKFRGKINKNRQKLNDFSKKN